MTPEIERLLGGYATNTLTEDERKLLYSAAIEDQQLFDALQDEQALRELLTDPESRREIVRALQPAPQKRSRTWMWALAGGFAALAAVLAIVTITQEDHNARQGRMTAIIAPQTDQRLAEDSSKIKSVKQASPGRAPQPKSKAKALPEPGSTELIAALEKLKERQALSGARVTPAALERMAVAAFVILQVRPDGTTVELNRSENIQPGESIVITMRQSTAGSLQISDQLKAPLQPGTPITIDRQKVIIVRWTAPGLAGEQTTVLDLTPGKPPVIQ